MPINIKSFLIHQYLYNLQFGIQGLDYLSSVYDGWDTTIQIPYLNLLKQHIKLCILPISKSAWRTENPYDYPVLLSDNGRLVQSLQLLDANFNIKLLIQWQLVLSFIFKNQIDIKSPDEINQKFGLMQPSLNRSVVSLTSHVNLYRQLCVYIAFILTIQDLFLYLHPDVNHD